MRSKNLQYAFYVEYYKKLPEVLEKKARYEKELKERKNGEKKKQEDPEAVYYRQMNKDILKIAERSDQSMRKLSEYDPEISMLEFTSCYPGILIGIGHSHGVKGKGEIGMGFTFDYVTGLPYLPGSSLKGIIRSGFKQAGFIHEVVQDVLDTELSDSEMIELMEQIFEGKGQKRRFIFYDAVICDHEKDKPVLALDVIAPHSPDGLKEPNPVTFLRICPGVKIHFEFHLHPVVLSTGKCIRKEEIKEIFKTILEDLGIGAKTNVGYGVLESKRYEEEPVWIKERFSYE